MLGGHTLHKKYVLLCILFVTIVNPVRLRKQPYQIKSLETLLSGGENKPIVIVLNTKTQQRHSDFNDLNNENEDGLLDADDYDDKVTEKSSAAYLLDHLLRTDNADKLDSSVEHTKEMLRSALRARCKLREVCVKKCSSKRPVCPKNCQQVFDDLDLCPPKPKTKKCKKPKCGKTMPPSWRF